MLSRNTLVLGLDLNTRCSGWAIVNGVGRYVSAGHIAKPQLERPLDIALEVLPVLEGLKRTHGSGGEPWVVGIEQYLQNMAMGKFNVKGMIRLAGANTVIEYACMQLFGTRPLMMHPHTIRSRYQLRKTADKDIKAVVYDYVRARVPEFEWPPPRKRSGKPDPASYDMADAYMVALSALHEHRMTTMLADDDEYEKWAGTTTAATTESSNRRKAYERYVQKTLEPL